MARLLKPYKWMVVGGFILVLIIAGVIIIKNQGHQSSKHTILPKEAAAVSAKHVKKTKPKKVKEVVIDLKGAVKHPGVYQMKAGDRVHQLLKKAGGTVKKADEQQINLAAVLQDGMVVYIPSKGEKAVQAQTEATASVKESEEEQTEVVNINNASSKELQSIPGVGPSKADAIVAYREENGSFQKIEDITNVTGIGEKSFEKMKSSLSVN
ncbi:helix-hairpin-helix domain-containing protein [Bacillus sp. CLL-7-23]|uniref:Helix-hairpin-helix domain-containing protein n=1 Tax=Bacillus changyiensis TaxID=3004103 RepID=A0ABT4X687_9BACI|nr:helix-hairpin-helix domain-containing protein [Bacillus changyiensis]MDA7026872.1 helix-hairpin-helix domain-containing protein [Bacillus changyiensis]